MIRGGTLSQQLTVNLANALTLQTVQVLAHTSTSLLVFFHFLDVALDKTVKFPLRIQLDDGKQR